MGCSYQREWGHGFSHELRCTYAKELCSDEDGDAPFMCSIRNETGLVCPACHDRHEDIVKAPRLVQSGHGLYWCPNCENCWKQKDDLEEWYQDEANLVCNSLVAQLKLLVELDGEARKPSRSLVAREIAKLATMLECESECAQ